MRLLVSLFVTTRLARQSWTPWVRSLSRTHPTRSEGALGSLGAERGRPGATLSAHGRHVEDRGETSLSQFTHNLSY